MRRPSSDPRVHVTVLARRRAFRSDTVARLRYVHRLLRSWQRHPEPRMKKLSDYHGGLPSRNLNWSPLFDSPVLMAPDRLATVQHKYGRSNFLCMQRALAGSHRLTESCRKAGMKPQTSARRFRKSTRWQKSLRKLESCMYVEENLVAGELFV